MNRIAGFGSGGGNLPPGNAARLCNKLVVSENDLYDHIASGNQHKYIKNNCFIKVDEPEHSNGLSEELTCMLLDCSNLEHAQYRTKALFMSKNGVETDTLKNCAVSPNFTMPNEQVMSFYSLMDANEVHSFKMKSDMNGQFDMLVDCVKNATNLDCTSYMLKTLSLDMLIYNPDRHLRNLSVVKNVDTGKFRLAPCYDNGLALLSNFNLFPLEKSDKENCFNVPVATFNSDDPEDYINFIGDKVKSKSDILIIDAEKFYQNMDGYKNSLYPKKYVDRCKSILLNRMKELEGDVWLRGKI
jgi:hypothetical protein